MPPRKHSQSTLPNAIACVRVLFALSLGWLLVPALAPVSAAGQDNVQIEAELRVGDRPAAPVAEVASAQASLRALSARIRSGSQQLLATPAPLSALLVALHARSLAQHGSIDPPHAAVRGIIRWQWPLPRSTCGAEDEPSARPKAQGAS